MISKIMYGKALSSEIMSGLGKRADELKKGGIVPKLDIILVGDNPASEIYVRKKTESAKKIGMEAELHRFGKGAGKEEIASLIKELNADEKVHGLMVQLPLPGHLDTQAILDGISPGKDVDGLTTFSMGMLLSGKEGFEPCTARGIMKMLGSEGIPVEGKEAVVVGRSNIIGKPMAVLLLRKNATVTLCHSKTRNLGKHTGSADILVVAAGKPALIKKDMVKKGATVIDVGINRTKEGIRGDVDFEDVKGKASHITPVPGGVGPLTVAMVLENTIISAERTIHD